ncbi:MAG: flagellar hook-basal body protein [Butyrivibrio sp.]|uniref:flagellar hook-basal body protein n=1 Tax=Butyrivibrio sp. TaxID=28121 RepID=UPI0025DB461F|nr:flagellar hook-basal body protein [Butyrivibrio sp.]MCR5770414.1 flagellar hook-basal body protein [Butyrivibrio sp.]
MVKGLYTAWSAMINEQHRMDVATNNLANANTNGYKKEGSTQQTFSAQLALKIKDTSEPGNYPKRLGHIVPGVKTGEDYTDWTEGPMKETGNTWDLAISGNGFFAIDYTSAHNNVAGHTEGQQTVMYTRDGNFTLTADGELVTQDGDYVLDSEGEHIVVDTTKKHAVNVKGQVLEFTGEGEDETSEVVATVGLYDFEDYDALAKYGENLYEPTDEAVLLEEATGSINAGFLEQSNVSVVDEMVSIINIQRHYEAASTMIQTADSTLNTATTELGRL